MITANPLLVEQLRYHLSDSSARRSYRFYIITLTVVVLVTWPSRAISFYLQFSSKPITLPFTFMLMFIIAVILAMTGEYYQNKRGTTLVDWVSFSQLKVLQAYWGRFLFFMAHSVFLLLLPAPLLVAAAAASGISLLSLLQACIVAFFFCIFLKSVILMLELIFHQRLFARVFIIGLILLFTVLLSVRFLAAANPILSIQSVLAQTVSVKTADSQFDFLWTGTIAIYTGATIAAAAASLLRLSYIKRNAEEAR